MENTCVCCGKEIPEGCHVCYECEHAPNLQVRSCADCANKSEQCVPIPNGCKRFSPAYKKPELDPQPLYIVGWRAGFQDGVQSVLSERQKQNDVQKWISCSERLPEFDTMVIVCYYGSDCIYPMQGETVTEAIARQNKVPTVTIGFLDEDGWNGADMFPMMVQPTFWMNFPDAPLPEHPEKE